MSHSTETPPLDYRAAASGGAQLIARDLLAGETLSTTGAVAKLAGGMVMCLIGPLFLTGIVADRRDASFLPIFLLLCFIVIPLLLWLERRTRGKFLEDSVAGESPGYSSYGEFELRGTTFLWTLYTEIALLGPRLLWSVYDWWQGRYAAASPVRAAAAELAMELFEAGEGRPIADLVRIDRPRSFLYPAIKYLVWRQWADVSAKKDRVWLQSPARKRIEFLLGNARRAAGMEE